MPGALAAVVNWTETIGPVLSVLRNVSDMSVELVVTVTSLEPVEEVLSSAWSFRSRDDGLTPCDKYEVAFLRVVDLEVSSGFLEKVALLYTT